MMKRYRTTEVFTNVEYRKIPKRLGPKNYELHITTRKNELGVKPIRERASDNVRPDLNRIQPHFVSSVYKW